MTEVLTAACAGDEQAFRELTDPYRRELQLHCYRLLGSLQDAEDVVQETLLAAWRGLAEFEQRSSVRTWLYRIATNRALNVMRSSRRHPVQPIPFEVPEPTARDEIQWLQPYPDELLDADPEKRYQNRESVELAFIVALQQLPPRQAAVLVLREVLEFSGAEAAELLGTSPAAVKAALQRARATLDALRAPGERPPASGSAAERALTQRFSEAFSNRDVDGMVELLTDDAWLTMPPYPHAYRGRDAIAVFLQSIPIVRFGYPVRLKAIRANTQPALAIYSVRDDTEAFELSGLLVLTLSGNRLSALTHFSPTELLLAFGLDARAGDQDVARGRKNKF
ncbi:RNA polymerase subunit sigma-70 [Nocardia sp. NPDC127526]|uniref:RNA polymerase subunit sigma-70 n=1 Tax=Nocardia sp. NPDC127526 TaxID=3345393 RepID=UPI003626F84B